MNDWAERAATEADNRDRLRELNLEKNSRESHLKTVFGGKLFGELYNWISAQTKKFNEIRGKEELKVSKTVVPGVSGQSNDRLSVHLHNLQPLVIDYCSTSHILSYACGMNSRKEFKLQLSDSNESAAFTNPYNQPITIDELGSQMLDALLNSPF